MPPPFEFDLETVVRVTMRAEALGCTLRMEADNLIVVIAPPTHAFPTANKVQYESEIGYNWNRINEHLDRLIPRNPAMLVRDRPYTSKAQGET